MKKLNFNFLAFKLLISVGSINLLTDISASIKDPEPTSNESTFDHPKKPTRKVETSRKFKDGLYNAKHYTLNNGLEIVLIENDLAPVIDLTLYYKVGTADDPAELHGISHFLEHMMFKGTRLAPGQSFTRLIQQYGGETNAYTSPDITAYKTTISAEHLDLLLRLEADRMINLNFTEKDVNSEKQVVQEERRMRLENHPIGKTYENLLRSLFTYHPYGVPTIGYPHHINAYNYTNTRQHYEKWYAPNNAILVISGALPKNTLGMIKTHFNPIPSKALPIRNRPQDPDISERISTSISVKSERISQTSVFWYYKAPNHKQVPLNIFHAINILQHLLAGHITSPFHMTMVEEKKLATGVGSHYPGDQIDPKHFEIRADLAPGVNLADLKAAVSEYIKKLKKDGLSAGQLREAKNEMLAHLAFSQDGTAQSVNDFGNLAFGFTLEHIEHIEKYLNAVTVDDMRKAIEVIFSTEPEVIMTLYPKTTLVFPNISKDEKKRQGFWSSIEGKALEG